MKNALNHLTRSLFVGTLIVSSSLGVVAAPPMPASSVAGGPRAGVSINQGDIYNQINNAVNIGNGAVNIGNAAYNLGSTAYNTANSAYNLGSIAYQTAENANARAGAAEAAAASAGVITKFSVLNNGQEYTVWVCVKGFYNYNDWNYPCPAGSGHHILTTSRDVP